MIMTQEIITRYENIGFTITSYVLLVAAGVVGLAWHTPLFPHHFIVLLPPLILSDQQADQIVSEVSKQIISFLG